MKTIYKYLYFKCYTFYFILCTIRQFYFIFTNQKSKAIKIVTEHYEWENNKQ